MPRRGGVSRVVGLLRALFYLAVAVGLVVWLWDLYVSQQGWSVGLAEAPRVAPEGTNLRIGLVLDVYNPSGSTVRAKLVWYNIYMNGYYVGEGLIPYLELRPGHNIVRASVDVDVLHLPCAVARALSQGRVSVDVKGYAMVTLMLFGRIPYRDVTVPIKATPYQWRPSLDPATRNAVRFVDALCRLAEEGRRLGLPLPATP